MEDQIYGGGKVSESITNNLERINDDNVTRKTRRFLHNFFTVISNVQKIQDNREYFVKLVREDYLSRLKVYPIHDDIDSFVSNIIHRETKMIGQGSMDNSNKDWCVYVLKCNDGTYYTGATNDIVKRLLMHNRGKGSKYTRARLPVSLLAVRNGLTQRQALQLEYKVKKQTRKFKVKFLKECDVES